MNSRAKSYAASTKFLFNRLLNEKVFSTFRLLLLPQNEIQLQSRFFCYLNSWFVYWVFGWCMALFLRVYAGMLLQKSTGKTFRSCMMSGKFLLIYIAFYGLIWLMVVQSGVITLSLTTTQYSSLKTIADDVWPRVIRFQIQRL